MLTFLLRRSFSERNKTKKHVEGKTKQKKKILPEKEKNNNNPTPVSSTPHISRSRRQLTKLDWATTQEALLLVVLVVVRRDGQPSKKNFFFLLLLFFPSHQSNKYSGSQNTFRFISPQPPFIFLVVSQTPIV